MDTFTSKFEDEKLKFLKEIMPEVFVEGKIDFEKLKATLGENIDFNNERYVLNWAGKSEAFRVLQRPCTKTLVPNRDESINFDETDNIFIEGENLEVLKILQKSYFGKIKMIYIDPPYNTGNDSFIYPDKFSETLFDYQKRIGDKDENGYMVYDNVFRKNSKENGQYHSNWLNMMMPRLYLARNLLRQDGVIFISIDDNEVHNLRLLMNEIFGEENFVGCAGRITKKSNNKGDYWSPNFDYVLTYVKNIEFADTFFGGCNYKAYNLIEESGQRKGEKYQLVRLYMSTIQNRNPEQRFWIECPDGSKVIPPGDTFPPERPNLGDGIWRWTRKKFEEERDKIVIKEVRSSNLINENKEPAKWNVFTKTYLQDVINNSSAKPNSFIEDYINQIGSHELNSLGIPFDYAKPSTLIKYLAEISKTRNDDIILDFFAGSGTTAHAVMELNKEDGGSRKYICVQLPESCESASSAYKAGFNTIADICKERIRRVSGKIASEVTQNSESIDLGFKVFKLADSNFKQWQQIKDKNSQSLLEQMNLFVDPVAEHATTQNMIYEFLLKSGKSLSSHVEQCGDYISVNDNELILVLEVINQNIITEIIAKNPQKVIALDRLFTGNDQLKTNTCLQMKDANIEFKTV